MEEEKLWFFNEDVENLLDLINTVLRESKHPGKTFDLFIHDGVIPNDPNCIIMTQRLNGASSFINRDLRPDNDPCKVIQVT
jgi:uncharacterized protein YdcH (DUF465 family)